MPGAMDDLEKAVVKLLRRKGGEASVKPPSRDAAERGNRPPEAVTNEAAELIRRAIRRLRSL